MARTLLLATAGMAALVLSSAAAAQTGATKPTPAQAASRTTIYEAAFFAQTSRKELGVIMGTAMTGALQRNGFDPALIRQGSLFTRGGL